MSNMVDAHDGPQALPADPPPIDAALAGAPGRGRRGALREPAPARSGPVDGRRAGDAELGPTGRPWPELGDPPPLADPRPPAIVIAVCNQKGGVGKTTTTITLGAALAELGRRVLLVDFDPQGSLSVGLGVNPHTLEHSIYNLMLTRDVDDRGGHRPHRHRGRRPAPEQHRPRRGRAAAGQRGGARADAVAGAQAGQGRLRRHPRRLRPVARPAHDQRADRRRLGADAAGVRVLRAARDRAAARHHRQGAGPAQPRPQGARHPRHDVRPADAAQPRGPRPGRAGVRRPGLPHRHPADGEVPRDDRGGRADHRATPARRRARPRTGCSPARCSTGAGDVGADRPARRPRVVRRPPHELRRAVRPAAAADRAAPARHHRGRPVPGDRRLHRPPQGRRAARGTSTRRPSSSSSRPRCSTSRPPGSSRPARSRTPRTWRCSRPATCSSRGCWRTGRSSRWPPGWSGRWPRSPGGRRGRPGSSRSSPGCCPRSS